MYSSILLCVPFVCFKFFIDTITYRTSIIVACATLDAIASRLNFVSLETVLKTISATFVIGEIESLVITILYLSQYTFVNYVVIL